MCIVGFHEISIKDGLALAANNQISAQHVLESRTHLLAIQLFAETMQCRVDVGEGVETIIIKAYIS